MLIEVVLKKEKKSCFIVRDTIFIMRTVKYFTLVKSENEGQIQKFILVFIPYCNPYPLNSNS